MIIAKPNGGLCNRMRVINSCMHLIQENAVPNFQLIWEKNSLLNASFSQIFQPLVNVNMIERSRRLDYFRYYQFAGKSSIKQKLAKLVLRPFIFNYKYYDDKTIMKFRFMEQYWDKGHSNAIFNTCEDFYLLKPSSNYFHLFKPIESLQARIDYLVSSFQQSTIGVHIRRTDNLISTQISKKEFFLNKIDRILSKRPDTLFYLSTDDLEIEAEFKIKYGHTILTLTDKDTNRESLKGIEDAVIDLYALSQTNYILGSYFSSFSDVASWINGAPLQIVKS